MWALSVEEQRHMYDKVVGVYKTKEDALVAETMLGNALYAAGYLAEALYTSVTELPEVGSSAIDNAITFISENRNL